MREFRLTDFVFSHIDNSHIGYVANDHFKCVQKLGKLEDLEEELGCPLEVVLKLFNKDIVVNGSICVAQGIIEDGCTICVYYYDKVFGFTEIEPLSNYGKTWWLKGDYYVDQKSK